jgi:UDP-hydrolysing UDP-N-acetyl-D-glucosamine 2-epimerase
MKLLFLTGSRGEWGYIRPILRLCVQRRIPYHLCVTNMHLLPAYGLSVNDIKADGFRVGDEIFMSLEGHNQYTMAKSLGIFMISFVDVLKRVRPDWLILAGDRGEQMAGALAAAYTYVPIAHIQAGELSGNIDGHARHAIGKFAHLHFASNRDAADRLRRLGEQPFRIKLVGAPQLDELIQGHSSALRKLEEKYDIDLRKPYLIIVQHSVTEEYDQAERQMQATLEAVNTFAMTKIFILPNNDAGCDAVRNSIMQKRKGESRLFPNLPREDYLGFLKHAACLVGNSSSGILEAPTYRIPVVNLGRRQANRLQGKNVLNAPFEVDKIKRTIQKACSVSFRHTFRNSMNPYGDGHSSERILKWLEETPRDTQLLSKQLTY